MHCDNYTSLFKHLQTTHRDAIPQWGGGAIKSTTESALNGAVHVLTIHPSEEDKYDLLVFFYNIRESVKEILVERCEAVKHLKWYLNVQVEFIRETLDGESDISQPYFKKFNVYDVIKGCFIGL